MTQTPQELFNQWCEQQALGNYMVSALCMAVFLILIAITAKDLVEQSRKHADYASLVSPAVFFLAAVFVGTGSYMFYLEGLAVKRQETSTLVNHVDKIKEYVDEGLLEDADRESKSQYIQYLKQSE